MTEVTKWVAADVEAAIAPMLDAFVATAQPRLRKCAEAVYEELLYSVQDYLKDNAQWNLGAEIDRCRKIEAENRELRAKFEPFATIPDPQAFMEAARGMREALEAARVRLVRIAGRDFDCSPHQHGMAAAGHAQQGVHDVEAALAAFDATLGEQ